MLVLTSYLYIHNCPFPTMEKEHLPSIAIEIWLIAPGCKYLQDANKRAFLNTSFI